MANIKKNFLYNLLLTVAGYIFPFLTFPYISRVLGAENIGIVNFASSLIDYFILFSTLGISIVGMREIARSNEDIKTRSKTFSQLVSLHATFSVIALIVYILCIYAVPQLAEHKFLYWIGASKIILNVFLVEWLFRGIQNFKYITLRTLITRSLYVIAVFIFVRDRDDYDIYFIVTMCQVLLNAFINWNYSRKYVTFIFSLRDTRQYVYPLFSWGLNMILLSFYTTFNVMYLGFSCDSKAVGYYTTATKLYAIILSVLQAYNGVFIPYLNSLRAKGDMVEFGRTIGKSFNIVSTCTIPMVAFCFIMAPEIILLIAGNEFTDSILPFRIVLFQVIIIGISQITNSQILLSLKKDKEILISTIAGSVTMIAIVVLFVPRYAQIAAAWAVLLSHIVEFFFLFYFAKRSLKFDFPYKAFLKTIVYTIPIILCCIICQSLQCNYIVVLGLTSLISGIYYMLIQYYVVKNDIIINLVNKVVRK